ncbi:DUF4362 domain-containing protein [Rossellomorea sp. AcN35-11]|nr:DUF4362 domain-containing protein [Rossellomorea aquimaris]WJV27796.1 DUF4362 domain-containing protein [Rossellomorea sp. AcN35-11]
MLHSDWKWMFAILLVFLTGCQGAGQVSLPNSEVVSELNPDVVNMHGGISGLGKMENYYQQIEKEEEGDLRIIHYTKEGDPILADLSYDGKQIHVEYDYTRDQYGNGRVDTFQCGKLKKEENPTNLTYYLTDCNGIQGQLWEVLTASYNVKQQDVFEVELTYGEKHTVELEDVDKQEIYKQLVLANYLNEVPGDDTCGKNEQTIPYSMYVKINGGERTLNWLSCDSPVKTNTFTAIAEYIIQASKNPTHSSGNVMIGYILSIEDNELFMGEDLTILDYEMVKDLKPDGVEGYMFNFVYIETDVAHNFSEGDKIAVEVERQLEDGAPARVSASRIEKVNE